MPRLSSSGSFAGVYGLGGSAAAGATEDANYVGAVMVFQQSTAPTGWTKVTTDDDAMLTCTTGSLTTGGTLGFASAFTNASLSGTASGASVSINSTTLTADNLVSHRHQYVGASIQNPRPGSGIPLGFPTTASPNPFVGPGEISAPYTGPTGHVHPNPPGPFSSSSPVVFFSKDLRIKYVDVIIASRN
jgi:hypothetical protein